MLGGVVTDVVLPDPEPDSEMATPGPATSGTIVGARTLWVVGAAEFDEEACGAGSGVGVEAADPDAGCGARSGPTLPPDA